MSYDTEPRCRRGERCKAAVTLQDRVTGEHLAWVGAELTGMDTALPRLLGATVDRDPVPGSLAGLCAACILEVDGALRDLTLDVAELTLLLPRALTGSSAEMGEITRPAPGPLMPMQERTWVLIELIGHETTALAELVTAAVGEEWDTGRMAQCRIGYRVQAATTVLRVHLGVFLSAVELEYEAKSLTEDPTSGHDPAVVFRRRRQVWKRWDGVDAGRRLLSLHRSARAIGGHKTGPDQLRMPCRNRGCHQLALLHWPGDDEVVCSHCGHRSSWEDYDVLRSHLIGTATVSG